MSSQTDDQPIWEMVATAASRLPDWIRREVFEVDHDPEPPVPAPSNAAPEPAHG